MKMANFEVEKSQKNVATNCKFILAMFCVLFGGAIHVVTLPFCPLILLSTSSSFAILMSTGLAVMCLKERISWFYDSIAFALISSGTTAIVFMSKENETQLDAQDVKE